MPALQGTGRASYDRLLETRLRLLATARPSAKLRCVTREATRVTPALLDDADFHSDGRHEFGLVLTGQARVHTPDRQFLLSPGDLLLVGPGVVHAEFATDPPQAHAMFWCAADHSYALMCHTSFEPPDTWGGIPWVELHGRTNVQSVALAIESELSNRAWGWQRSVHALLQYFACILIRRLRHGQQVHRSSLESPAIPHDPELWEVVQRALEFCRASFKRGVRVEEVAQAVGYSESRLSHLFSSYVGQSVGDYVRGLRLARARDLLETTEATIGEIAEGLGYGDPAHFTRAFVRRYGLSPRALRQQLRGQ